MTIEDSGTNHTQDHILDWLEDSVPFFASSFLDDPYSSSQINCYQLWDSSQEIIQAPINSSGTSLNSPTTAIAATPPNTTVSILSPPSDISRKRKTPDKQTAQKISQPHPGENQTGLVDKSENGNGVVEEVAPTKKSVGNKRNSGKANGNNCNNGNNKEGRWAEQLLNPCALAITNGNLTRVQHLLYVLRELASLSGDANHRLAAHGLQALTHLLSSSSSSSSASVAPVTFATTNPQLFQRSIIKFHEVSPWFAFPNNIVNSSILQILSEEPDRLRNLHIVDIGVSHGVQWPTLLEALTRRSGGPPPLVRLTVIAPTVENNQSIGTPFSIGPPEDNVSSRLLSFAKSLNINLQIQRLNSHPLLNLNAQIINTSRDEILIFCAQFRLHHLNHSVPDERTELLKILRKMEPKGVILSENDMECSCSNCGSFEMGFSRRVEYLWRFLDSTSSAFKGRESDERKVMEGEAAKALTNRGEMNEEKEKWCERMRRVGFVREVFGEDTIDSARALLRRYDSNWEMRVDEKGGGVRLWWKGLSVSFCSLWKLGIK